MDVKIFWSTLCKTRTVHNTVLDRKSFYRAVAIDVSKLKKLKMQLVFLLLLYL